MSRSNVFEMKVETQRMSKAVDKEVILVLGMHRSGTSMLAGILDRLGCKGPKTQPEANERNPKGYFESAPIFQLNDEILATAGTRWNDWQPLREDWILSPRFNEFRSRAAKLIVEEYGSASLIYLKDPRMCRLLPMWQAVFDELGYRVICIHTHRHPNEVASSMKARTNIEVEPSLGMLSWLRYILEAEIASRGLPRMFTSYSNLIDDWQSFIPRAEETFGFVWPVSMRAASERIAQLVDPRLRHHDSEIDTFLRDPRTPESFRETLETLERWARTGEDESDLARFDQLRTRFDQSAPLLYAPTHALEAATRQVKDLTAYKAAAEAHTVEIDALSRKLAETEGERAQFSSERAQLRAELTKACKELDTERAAAKIRYAEIETLSGQVTEAEDQRARLSSEQDQLRAELAYRQNRLEDAVAAAETRHTEIDALTRKLAEAEGQRGQLLSHREQLRAELDQNRSDLDATQARAGVLAAKLDDIQAREAILLDDAMALTNRIIDRDKKISGLQRRADLKRHEAAARATEIERLSDRLAESERQRTQLASENEQLSAELAQKRSGLQEALAATEALQSRIEVLTQSLDETTCQHLTDMEAVQVRAETFVRKLEEATAMAISQEVWLSQLYAFLEHKPWWSRLIPIKWERLRRHKQLHRKKLFDAKKYLEAYPDVTESGMDPVRHYIMHGMQEGRICPR